MIKLKVYSLIEALSTSDREFIAFIMQAPRLDSRKDIRTLYQQILKQNERCTRDSLWKAVYPGREVDEQKFVKLCFETVQEIEYGLSLRRMQQDPGLRQQQLIRFYLENELHDLSSAKIDKALKGNSQQPIYGADSYWHQYQLEHLRFLHLQKQENVQSTLNIAASSAGLDRFYFLQKLKYICNSINYQAILGKAEHIEFREEIISMVENSSLISDRLISIYHAIYYVLHTPADESRFQAAKALVTEYARELEASELSDVIQYLINYCIKKINQSVDAYLGELFSIYGLYLERVSEKVFSPIRFKNIFLLALRMKKYEWAENFIAAYGPKLPKAQRDTTIAYNRARLFYEMKQYDKVLDTLLNLHYDEIQFNLLSKVLIVKTFYDKNEVQFLENYLLSFKAYILRNKAMNTQNKQIHLNFLKMVKKLIRLEYGSKAQLDKFKEKIQAFQNLPDKPWLLEKIEAL